MSTETAFLSNFQALDITEGLQTRALRLLSPFQVYSQSLDAIITVPAGFEFDGESIPDFLHGIVPPFGQSKRGACVHDYLYRFAGYHNLLGDIVGVTRAEADKVYLELVKAKGLPSWRANIRWTVLRLVGSFAWRSNRKTIGQLTLPT